MHGFWTSPLSYPTDALFAKKSEEAERIERLVQSMERQVKAAFLRFVQTIQSDEVLREVADFLGRGDIEAALGVVDRYIARMAPVLSDVFITAARAEVAALAEQVRSWAPSAGIAFDPSNEAAAALMRDAQLQFIREMTTSQRDTIRQALTQGLMDGSGPREMARAFRNSIGLTARQEEAVRNYRRLLEMGSAEALDRDLRDRRYDRSVERADRTGEPMKADAIDRMEAAYRRRYIAYRAETIARTETARVTGEARQEAIRQTLGDAGIDAELVERVWRSTPDKRVRHTHRAMNGQKVGLEETFKSPSGAKLRFPGDPLAPASETVACRCVVVNRIKKPEGGA